MLREALASVVVLLVALPLCMGIAIASGVPPALGLVSGVIGGIVIGALGGCRLQVSGPAAGLVVLVYDIIAHYGIASLGVAGLLAGMLQIVAARMRMGRWFRATSPSVIHGMLAGIGVLIIASQVHVTIDDTPRSSGLANLLSIPDAIGKAISPLEGSVHHLAAFVGFVTIASVVLWERFRPKRLTVLPGALVGVLAGAAVAHLGNLPMALVHVPNGLMDELNVPTAAAFALLADPGFLGTALMLAVIASAESLLSASAVDQMQTGPRTDYDRELQAQGIGNMVAGALGALPLTGVIVRSSANVNAGATTRLSSMLHGIWLAAILLLVPGMLSHIPTASLGAILLFTGYKLVNPRGMMHAWRASRWEFAVFFVTMVLVVVDDLLMGVGVGLALTAGRLLIQLSQLHIRVKQRDGLTIVRLRGAATFVSLPRLAEALDRLPSTGDVYVDITALSFVDHTCVHHLQTWAAQARAREQRVLLDENYLLLVQNPTLATVDPDGSSPSLG